MDIFIALLCMIILAFLLGLAGHRLGKGSARKRQFLGAGTVLFIVLYLTFLRQNPYLLKILPFSNALFWTNWLLPAVGFLIGAIWSDFQEKIIRRNIGSVCLFMLAFHYSFGFVFAPMPECHGVWTDEICLQSSPSSCAAASSATLLGFYGIKATEAEMAKLCFTGDKGTHWFGTYRGLKLKTAATPYDVEVFCSDNIAFIKKGMAPVLLKVGVPLSGIDDMQYENKWGWTRGVSHTVVLFGPDLPGYIDMGDPSVGREHWKIHSLEDIWSGHGFRLVKRETK